MEHAYMKDKRGAGLIRSTVLSFLFSVFFAVVLLMLSAVLLSRYDDPSRWMHIVGVLSPAITAFFGGILAGKAEGKQGALAGLLGGLPFVLLLFIVSRFVGGVGLSALLTLLSYTALLLLFVLGGTLGASKKTRRRRRRTARR
jgi:putative membrane protein (TIGR04086 family)